MGIDTQGISLGHEDIMCLAKAPSAVFMLVAAADGKIDDKELQAFINIIREDEYKILLSAIYAANSSPPEMLEQMQSEGGNIVDLLVRLNAILNVGFSADIALGYKVALFKFARGIAEFAGGFSSYDSSTRPEEKAALLLIFHLLELRKLGYS